MKASSRTRLPVDQALTSTVDKALKRNLGELRDYTAAFHERWHRWGVTTIRGSGWSLRPMFLPARKLDFVAASLHARLSALRHHLRSLSQRPGQLGKVLPLPKGFERAIDVDAGLASQEWLAHLRPDGFLFEDRFVLSEINFGNGLAVSCGYTEVVHDYWRGHPVLRKLGLNVAQLHRRPLPRYLNVIRRSMRASNRPFVALLAHHHEWEVILGYPKRVEDQFDYVQRELYRLGVESRIVTEQELVVGRDGNPSIIGDDRRPDLIVLVTIGSSFFDHPKLLEPGGPLAHLRGERIGDVPIIKPLAATLMDKGTLPLLHQLEPSFTATAPDGFRFEIAATEHPLGQRGAKYLGAQNDWVFKRAFDGKDTHIGVARSKRDWAQVVKGATSRPGYVAQRYVSMPRTEIPVFIDEKHLEWVPSRVELSSFIFEGNFGGAAARHAPEAEGLVMTDPPPDYGFTTVFAV